MPYNNNPQYMYPQSYQQAVQMPYIPQQYQIPSSASQASSPSSNNLIWVQGESAAKAYPVAPGTSQLLMDSESECFYIKTTDASGMPLPLRTFSYKEIINVPKNSSQSAPQNNVPQIDTSAFVTRAEFNELKQMIEEFRPSGKVD